MPFSEVILLKLIDGKVTEFVNGKLELEEVQRFDVDLDERRLVVGRALGVEMTYIDNKLVRCQWIRIDANRLWNHMVPTCGKH